MPIEHKRGALSTKEMEFIENNCTKISVHDIAEKLNRNEEPIHKYIKKKNLATIDFVEGDEQRLLLRNRLERRYYWPSIKAQLITKNFDEIEMFTNKWIDMMIQFKEDVLPMEEEQMKELILLSIQMDRIRFQEATNLREIDDLEEKLKIEYAKPEPAPGAQADDSTRDMMKIDRWENRLVLAKASSEACVTQIKNINHDIDVLNKGLKGTRDQRFKNVESGEKTFSRLIRKLQDDEKREQLSREIELVRIATERQREKLYDFHPYGDGSLDQPILNAESVKYIEEKNKVDEKVL